MGLAKNEFRRLIKCHEKGIITLHRTMARRIMALAYLIMMMDTTIIMMTGLVATILITTTM